MYIYLFWDYNKPWFQDPVIKQTCIIKGNQFLVSHALEGWNLEDKTERSVAK